MADTLITDGSPSERALPFTCLDVHHDGQILCAAETGEDRKLHLGEHMLLFYHGFLEGSDGWSSVAGRFAGSVTEIDKSSLLLDLAGCFTVAVLFQIAPASSSKMGEVALVVGTDSLGRHPLFYRQSDTGSPSSSKLELRVHKPPAGPGGGDDGWHQHCPRTIVLLRMNAPPEVLCSRELLPPPMPLSALGHLADLVTTDDGSVLEFVQRIDFAIGRALSWCGYLDGKNVGQPLAVLFSGGVDSTTLAVLCKRRGLDVRLFTSGFQEPGYDEPEDISKAQVAADWLGLPWTPVKRCFAETLRDLEELIPLIADVDVVKIGVALTFSAACRAAAETGASLAFSGGGSEELLSGYYFRHLQRPREEAKAAGLSGLRTMYHRDLQRDFAVGALHGMSLLHPYLDSAVAPHALSLPHEMKRADQEKALLRRVLEALGAPAELFMRRKRAAQYGSRFHVALEKLAKRASGGGRAHRVDIVRKPELGATHCNVALLYTSGKESAHAYQCIRQQHVRFTCVLSFNAEAAKPQDVDAGARHVRHVREAAELFSKCAGLPLLTTLPRYGVVGAPAPGQFVTALRDAAAKYDFGGVVCGHSTDLRALETLEEACDAACLKCFSPVGNGGIAVRCMLQTAGGAEVAVTRVPPGCPMRPGTILQSKQDLEALEQAVGENVGGRLESDAGLLDCLPLRSPFYSGRRLLLQLETPEENLDQLPLLECCEVAEDSETNFFRSYVDEYQEIARAG